MFFAVVILGKQSLGNFLKSEPSLLRECREINSELSESDLKKPSFFLAEPEQILMEKEHCAVCQSIIENHNGLKGKRAYLPNYLELKYHISSFY